MSRCHHRRQARGMRARRVGTVLVALLLLGACTPAPAGPAAATKPAAGPTAEPAAAPTAPAPYTVRWAAISANPNNFLIYAAYAKGFLAEQGLDLEIIYT